MISHVISLRGVPAVSKAILPVLADPHGIFKLMFCIFVNGHSAKCLFKIPLAEIILLSVIT